MIRKTLPLSLLMMCFMLICFQSNLFAQTPQGVNYQAVARDNNGNMLDNQLISVRFGILKSSSTGQLVYEEEYSMITTNDFGLFSLVIGRGISTGSGSLSNFSDIDWGSDNHFLKVLIDAGNGFEDLGTTQLLSVPYALYALKSGDSLVAGNAGVEIRNDSIFNRGDLSNTNELITRFELLNDSILVINEGGNADTVDLSIFTDQLVNQTLALGTKIGNAQIISISGGNQIQFSVADGDSSALNEIQVLSLNGAGDSILLNNGGSGIRIADLGFADDQQLSLSGDSIKLSGVNPSFVNLSPLLGVDTVFQLNDTALVIENHDGTRDTLIFAGVTSDTSATNELVDSLILNNGVLELYQQGSLQTSVSFDTLGNIKRALILNQVLGNKRDIDSLQKYSSIDSVLTIQNRDSINQVVALLNASIVADLDKDSLNERISSVGLVGDSLQIIENDSTFYVNLNRFNNTSLDNQNLEIRNDSLFIENGLGNVFLGQFRDTAAINALQVQLNNHLALDQDLDAGNELIDSAKVIGSELQIYEAGDTTKVDLSAFNNAGTDDQNLEIRNDSLFIENGLGNVYLGQFRDTAAINALQVQLNNHLALDQDLDAGNELIDSAKVIGSELQIYEAGDTTRVDLSAFNNAGTDDQNLEIRNDSLFIENGLGNVFLGQFRDTAAINALQVQLNNHLALDQDLDAGNELIDSAKVIGSELQIYEAGDTTRVDLSAFNNAGTDDQNIEIRNDSLFIENGLGNVFLGQFRDTAAINALQVQLNNHLALDQDLDAGNELIDSAKVIGSELQIYEAGDTTRVDLSAFNNAGTDDQNLEIRNDSLFIENGLGNVFLGQFRDTAAINALRTEIVGRFVSDSIRTDSRFFTDSIRIARDSAITIKNQDSLRIVFNLLNQSNTTDLDGDFTNELIDSIRISNDSLLIYENGNIRSVYLDSLGQQERDSLLGLILINQQAIIDSSTLIRSELADSTAKIRLQLADSSATLRTLIGNANTDDQNLTLVSPDSIAIESGQGINISVLATDAELLTDSLALAAGILNNAANIGLNAQGILDSTAKVRAELRDTAFAIRSALLDTSNSIRNDMNTLSGGLETRFETDSALQDLDSIRLDNFEAKVQFDSTNFSNAIIANAQGIVDSTANVRGELRDSSMAIRSALVDTANNIRTDMNALSSGLELRFETDSALQDLDSIRLDNFEAKVQFDSTNFSNAIIANAQGIVDSTANVRGYLSDSSMAIRSALVDTANNIRTDMYAMTEGLEERFETDSALQDLDSIRLDNFEAKVQFDSSNFSNAIIANAQGIVDSTANVRGYLSDSSMAIRSALVDTANNIRTDMNALSSGLELRFETDSALQDLDSIRLDNFEAKVQFDSTNFSNAIIANAQGIVDSTAKVRAELNDTAFAIRSALVDTASNIRTDMNALSSGLETRFETDSALQDLDSIRLDNFEAKVQFDSTNFSNAIIANAQGIVDSTANVRGELRDSSMAIRSALVDTANNIRTDMNALSSGLELRFETDSALQDLDSIRLDNFEAKVQFDSTNFSNAIIANAQGIVDSTANVRGELRDSSMAIRSALVDTANNIRTDMNALSSGLELRFETDSALQDLDSIRLDNFEAKVQFDSTNFSNAIIANAQGIVDSTANVRGELRDSSMAIRSALVDTANNIRTDMNALSSGLELRFETDSALQDLDSIRLDNFEAKVQFDSTNFSNAIIANAQGIVDSTANVRGELRDSSMAIRSALVDTANNIRTDMNALSSGLELRFETDSALQDLDSIRLDNFEAKVQFDSTNFSNAIISNAQGIVDSTANVRGYLSDSSMAIRSALVDTANNIRTDMNALSSGLELRFETDSALQDLDSIRLDNFEAKVQFDSTNFSNAIISNAQGIVDSTANVRGYLSDSSMAIRSALVDTANNIRTDMNALSSGLELRFETDSALQDLDSIRLDNFEAKVQFDSTNFSNAIIANAQGIVDSTANVRGYLSDSSMAIRSALVDTANNIRTDMNALSSGLELRFETDSALQDLDSIRLDNFEAKVQFDSTNFSNAIISNAQGIVDSTANVRGYLSDSSMAIRSALVDTANNIRTDMNALSSGLELRFETDSALQDLDSIRLDNFVTQYGIDTTGLGNRIDANAAAIIAEASTRSTNDATEVTARTNADNAEQAARIAGDASLSGRIATDSTKLATHIAADGDLSSTNELNTTFQVNGSNLEITDAGGTKQVSLASLNTSSDNQNLSVTADSIKIEDGKGAYIGDIRDSISNYDTRILDNKTDIAANAAAIIAEASTRSTNDATEASARTNADNAEQAARIAGDASLSGRIATDSTKLATHIAADGDLSSTNELNTTFQVNGSNLEITDAGGTKQVSLASLNTSSDNQNLSVTADSIKIEDGKGAYIGDIRDSISNYDTRILDNKTDIAANAAAIIAEASTRSTNDATEASARTNADNAEQAARIAGDASLSGRIATDSTKLATHIAADGDLSSTNELNTTFQVNGSNLEITDAGGTKQVSLASLNTSSDNQNLSVTADSIKIEDGKGAYIGDIRDSISNYDTRLLDNKTDIAANAAAIIAEASTRSTNDATEVTARTNADNAEQAARIAGDASLSGRIATDSTKLATHIAADGDLSSTNELNTTFQVNGSNLEITDAGGTKQVSLASLNTSSDNQNLSVTADSIKIEDGKGAYIGDIRDSISNYNTRILDNTTDIATNANNIGINAGNITLNANGIIDSTANVRGYLSDSSMAIRSALVDTASNIRADMSALSGGLETRFVADSIAKQDSLGIHRTAIDANTAAIAADNDGDASNEIQTLSFNTSNDNLNISGTGGNTVNLGSIRNSLLSDLADTSAILRTLIGEVNTDNQSLSLNGTKDSILISGGTGVEIKYLNDSISAHRGAINGIINQVGINVADIGGLDARLAADSLAKQDSLGIHRTAIDANTAAIAADNDGDASNELNTGFQVNGGNLEITDAGGTLQVPITSLQRGVDTLSLIRSADSSTYVSTTIPNQIELALDDTVFFKFGKSRIDFFETSSIIIGNGAASNYAFNSPIEVTAIGENALLNNISGSGNTAIGTGGVLFNNTNGTENTSVGHISMRQLSSGDRNSAFGTGAMDFYSSGSGNTAIGQRAMENGSGDFNAAFGGRALNNNLGGNNNVAVGYSAGENSNGGSGNIFLGYQSGYNETGSNKLYIENSSSASPLIYGDFANDSVKVFGTFSIGNALTFPTTDGSPNQIMKTDGAGQLSFVDISSLGTGIYGGSGSLSAATEVSLGTHPLSFTSSLANAVLFDTNTLVINALNNLVGVGTANPIAKLHIASNDGLSLQIDNTQTSVSTTYAANINTTGIGNGNNIGVAATVSGATMYNAGFISNVNGTSSGLSYGIDAISSESSNGTAFGGRLRANSSDGIAYGLNAQGTSVNGTSIAYGVYTEANGTGNTNYGIYAKSSGAATNWAGYFEGDVYIEDTLRLNKPFTLTDNAGLSKVLTSDANGVASWQNAQGDNLGSHIATQNLDLGTNAIVGDGGSIGLVMNSAGRIGIGGGPAQTNRRVYVSTTTDQYAGQFTNSISGATNTSFGVDGISNGANPSGSNIGLKGEASGAGTNVGVQGFGSGPGNNSFSGFFMLGKFFIADSLGVGESNPGARLDINGRALIDTLTINSSFTFPSADGTSDQILKTDGSGNLSFVDVSTLISTPTLSQVLSAGNSGGNASITNINTITLSRIQGDVNNNLQFISNNHTKLEANDFMDLNSGKYIALNSGDSLALRTNSTTRLKIDKLGNIGIGRATPTSLLDVGGKAVIDTLNINSEYTFPSSDGDGNTYLKTDGAGNVTWAEIDTAVCPAGFTNVNGKMCIETAERTAASWFVANSTCTAAGYKLPTWGEWYGAVDNAVLTDETDDWEWVDGGTSNTARKVGNGGITNSANDNPATGSEVYRCLLYLK